MFRPGIRRLGGAVATLITSATLAGCGSDTSGNATAAEIDVRKLDVGQYSTVPLDLRYTYHHGLASGTQLAIIRMAEQMARGPEIDNRLKYQTGFQSIDDARTGVPRILADVNGPVAERNGMMFGLASSSSDTRAEGADADNNNHTAVRLAIMQFPTEEAAERASQEFSDADFAVAPDQNQSVAIPAYPNAHSHWRPTVPTIGSNIAHGKYVIDVHAGLPSTDIAALSELVSKTYAAEIPLLDAMPALSPEDLVRLPSDPDRMLNRTFNQYGDGAPDSSRNAAFGPRGFLLQVADQELWSKRAVDWGLDRMSLTKESLKSMSKLYRTRDSDTAAKLRSVILMDSHSKPADAPPGIPDATCGENSTTDWQAKRFRCAVNYRRYVATVEEDQIQDAHQRAAAQYALLANNQ